MSVLWFLWGWMSATLVLTLFAAAIARAEEAKRGGIR